MSHVGQLTEGEIEQEIQNKGLANGLRLTPQDIDKVIVGEEYWHVPDTTTVVCCLKLAVGYTVVGKAACVEPSNFDLEVGKKVAYDDARDQIWALEGYRLACMRLAMRRMQEEIDKRNAAVPDLGDTTGGA